MTHVGHNSLMRLGISTFGLFSRPFKALGFHSTNNQRTIHLCSFESTAGRDTDKTPPYCGYGNFVTSRRAFTDDTASGRSRKSNSSTDQSSDSTSSQSDYHQRYHRRSYEYRRSSNARDRARERKAVSEDQEGVIDSFTHYQRLNLEPGADLGAVKSAYYSLSKLYHPDLVGSDDTSASEKFRLITESYDVLSDEHLRSEYDRKLRAQSIVIKMPEDLARPGAPQTEKYDPVYRTQNADAIFRLRQESALAQEKSKNPEKFRAGTFKNDPVTDISSSREKIASLKRRINELDHLTFGVGNRTDFYQTHLRTSLDRKLDDLESHQDLYLYEDGGRSTDNGKRLADDHDKLAFFISAAIIIACGLALFNFLSDVDLASNLDEKTNLAPKKRSG